MDTNQQVKQHQPSGRLKALIVVAALLIGAWGAQTWYSRATKPLPVTVGVATLAPVAAPSHPASPADLALAKRINAEVNTVISESQLWDQKSHAARVAQMQSAMDLQAQFQATFKDGPAHALGQCWRASLANVEFIGALNQTAGLTTPMSKFDALAALRSAYTLGEARAACREQIDRAE